jgi:hypothetical protein
VAGGGERRVCDGTRVRAEETSNSQAGRHLFRLTGCGQDRDAEITGPTRQQPVHFGGFRRWPGARHGPGGISQRL